VNQVSAGGVRVISGGDTFFAKFGISSLFLVATVALLVLACLPPSGPPEDYSHFVLRTVRVLVFIALSMTVVFFCGGLKRVTLSETSLRVSNYLREIVVPLNEVSSIDQVDGVFYRVVIAFDRDTAFGRRIDFSPRGLSAPRPHPVVVELRAAVAAAKRS
jgi:hypothetical protein